MTKKAKPVSYPGVLSTPLERHPSYDLLEDPIWGPLVGHSPSPESLEGKMQRQIQESSNRLLSARLEKCPALFAYYKISTEEPNHWRDLALRLAADHVKGFKIKGKIGANPSIVGYDIKLWAEVRLIKLSGHHTDIRACEIYWKRNGKKGNEETLRRRFSTAKKILDAAFRGLSDEELKAAVLDCVSKFPERATGNKD